MIKKTFALLLLSSILSFAGSVSDPANIFGDDKVLIERKIESMPIWIETFDRAPGNNLKNYTDEKVKTLTDKGFLCTFTVHPREWRVSMNPHGLADSREMLTAAIEMRAKFKEGKFAEGLNKFADDLIILSSKQTTTTTEKKEEAVTPTNTAAMEKIILFTLGSAAILGLFIFFWNSRKKAKLLEEQHQEMLDELQKPIDKNKVATMGQLTPQPPMPKPQYDDVLKAKKKTKEEQYHSRYFESERRSMAKSRVHYPSYYPGIENDPTAFYLLMHSTYTAPVQHSIVTDDTPSVHSYSVPSHTPSYTNHSSYDPSPSYVSYDSGGSGGYDAGGGCDGGGCGGCD